MLKYEKSGELEIQLDSNTTTITITYYKQIIFSSDMNRIFLGSLIFNPFVMSTIPGSNNREYDDVQLLASLSQQPFPSTVLLRLQYDIYNILAAIIKTIEAGGQYAFSIEYIFEILFDTCRIINSIFSSYEPIEEEVEMSVELVSNSLHKSQEDEKHSFENFRREIRIENDKMQDKIDAVMTQYEKILKSKSLFERSLTVCSTLYLFYPQLVGHIQLLIGDYIEIRPNGHYHWLRYKKTLAEYLVYLHKKNEENSKKEIPWHLVESAFEVTGLKYNFRNGKQYKRVSPGFKKLAKLLHITDSSIIYQKKI